MPDTYNGHMTDSPAVVAQIPRVKTRSSLFKKFLTRTLIAVILISSLLKAFARWRPKRRPRKRRG